MVNKLHGLIKMNRTPSDDDFISTNRSLIWKRSKATCPKTLRDSKYPKVRATDATHPLYTRDVRLKRLGVWYRVLGQSEEAYEEMLEGIGGLR